MLWRRFEQDEIYPNLEQIEANGGDYPPLEDLVNTPIEGRSPIRLIAAHYALGGTQHFRPRPNRLVFLRDPVERAFSHVKHIQRLQQPDSSLWEVVNDPANLESLENEQVRYLADFATPEGIAKHKREQLEKRRLNTAIRNLKGCEFVGLSEHFDESVRLCEATFGWELGDAVIENVSPENEEMSADMRARLVELNQLDIELYDFGCRLFENRLRRTTGRKLAAAAHPLPA
jgi:hypothetical protein